MYQNDSLNLKYENYDIEDALLSILSNPLDQFLQDNSYWLFFFLIVIKPLIKATWPPIKPTWPSIKASWPPTIAPWPPIKAWRSEWLS